MFKIDKNIEILTDQNHKIKYPFLKMEVGDSFFIPEKDEQKRINLARRAASAGIAFSKSKRKGEVKFSTRKLEDGIRIWRIK